MTVSWLPVRGSDPVESREAAVRVVRAPVLLDVIRGVVRECPCTQHEVASRVMGLWPGRWQEDTIRSACARAGLLRVGVVRVGGRNYGVYGYQEPVNCERTNEK